MTPEERSAYNRNYYLQNREKEKARAVKWRADNPDQLKVQSRRATERYQSDPEHRKQKLQWGKESQGRCKPRIQAYEKMRGQKNREEIATYQKQYREDNAEELAANKLAWERQDKLKYPGKYSAMASEQRAKRLKRYVPWADKDEIQFFYDCRPEGCHVDHIDPLCGEMISGLHVPENLQWLPARDNRVKSNKWFAECG